MPSRDDAARCELENLSALLVPAELDIQAIRILAEQNAHYAFAANILLRVRAVERQLTRARRWYEREYTPHERRRRIGQRELQEREGDNT